MKNKVYSLGIETSCDDTSICLLKDNEIIEQITLSSIKDQQAFGGVVPELASRKHLSYIHNIFNNLFNKTKIKIDEVKCIYYTSNPGLPGSLHVGILFAKTLSFLLKIPAYPINHVYGHIFSSFIGLKKEEIKFPFLSLVVSGGTSTLYKVESYDKFEIILNSKDDSVGEVYDKVARALGWEYPGGPIIDKNYDKNKNNIKFIKNRSIYSEFSFSGIKTAVLSYINTKKMKNEQLDKIEIASSFQFSIIDEIIKKISFYKENLNIDIFSVGGGVSANTLLRQRSLELFNKVFLTKKEYTGDNAVMIAYYGYLLYN